MTTSEKGAAKSRHPETALLHDGRDPARQHGFVNPPAYRGSTVLFPTLDALDAYDEQPFRYGRHGTPTTAALEEAIARLEGGQRSQERPVRPPAVTGVAVIFQPGKPTLPLVSILRPTKL